MRVFGVGVPQLVARAGVLALALVLVACGSSKPIKTLEDIQPDATEARDAGGAETEAPRTDEVDSAAAPPPDEDVENAPDADGTTASESSDESESESEVAALPPVDDDPNSFLSLNPREIETRLGTPARVRREGQAEIHQYRGQYRGAGCVFDLFLYPNGDAAELRVTYVELRGDSLTKVERRNCLAGMLRARLRAS